MRSVVPLKVYYLDDEESLLEVFSDTFSSSECVVFTFADPIAFVQSVKTDPPDVVFLDYRLPGCTGDEVALRLDPSLPKVLVSGDLDLNTKAVFVAKFSKPYKIDEVGRFIRSLATKKVGSAKVE